MRPTFPWYALEERGVIRVVDINVEDCTLEMVDLERQINERTRLVAVGYASMRLAQSTMLQRWCD